MNILKKGKNMGKKSEKTTKTAQEIIKNIGGEENISNLMHCLTRLRFNVKDKSKVNDDAIKATNGVLTTQWINEQYQVVIGNSVIDVYDEVCEIANLEKKSQIDVKIDETPEPLTWRNLPGRLIDAISGSVLPLLPILIGAGLIKALVLLIQQFGWLPAESQTLATLSFVADAAYYFLPIYVGNCAAKKFGGTPALGSLMGAMLISPTFVANVTAGTAQSVFGLSMFPTTYTSTIIPVIMTTFIMSKLEKLLNKFIHKSVRTVLTPFIVILVMIPVSFCAIAPIGAMLSNGFAAIITFLYSKLGFITVGVFCGLAPFIVMTGMHIGMIPVCMQNIAVLGYDPLVLPGFFLPNFAQGAACLGVAVKTKNSELRANALSCAFGCIVPGVTEPAMYGINLKYKKPMLAAIAGSVVAGIYCGLTHTVGYAFAVPNLFAFTAYMSKGMINLVNIAISVALAIIITFIITLITYKEEN